MAQESVNTYFHCGPETITRTLHILYPAARIKSQTDKTQKCYNFTDRISFAKHWKLAVSRTEKEAVVTLDEYQLNQVTKFKYLGCITGSKGHIDEEINGRISKIRQNVGMM